MRKSKLMQNNRTSINNSMVTNKHLEPFRISDGVMKFGKHKGKKLSEVPRDYLEWMIKEMDLSPTRISAIKDVLK